MIASARGLDVRRSMVRAGTPQGLQRVTGERERARRKLRMHPDPVRGFYDDDAKRPIYLAYDLAEGRAAGDDLPAPVQSRPGQRNSERLPAAVPAEAGRQAGERRTSFDRWWKESAREDDGAETDR